MGKKYVIRIGLIVLYITEIFFALMSIQKQVGLIRMDDDRDLMRSGRHRPPPL